MKMWLVNAKIELSIKFNLLINVWFIEERPIIVITWGWPSWKKNLFASEGLMYLICYGQETRTVWPHVSPFKL